MTLACKTALLEHSIAHLVLPDVELASDLPADMKVEPAAVRR